jgi:hypothetical protein
VAINTNVAGSAGWYFKTLAEGLVARGQRIAVVASYLDGNAPLPEGAEGFREAYRAFQRKARTNFGELIVEACAERMNVAGFRVGDNTELDREATRIWSVNELATASADIHADMLGLGDGYAIVGMPKDGAPVITREDPRYVITAHDPLRPNRVVAALKMYRDEVLGKDIAYLYLPGVVGVAERDVPALTYPLTVDMSGFEWVDERRLPIPVVPVVRFRNRMGKGEFETHTDILDRINYMVLQRLVITAMQAFRQRATKGDLPSVDEQDNPIDYGAVFRPGPGALWLLPDGVEMWESSYTDTTPLLTAVKDDIRDLAAVTRTPMSMLLPDGQNQSAEGASFAREGLVFKAQDRIKRATYGWNTVMQLAMQFAGNGVQNVDTEWLDPERRSLAERADAASKLVPAGVPFKTIMTDVMQFPPDKVERMEQERLDDALNMALAAQPEPVTANGAQ